MMRILTYKVTPGMVVARDVFNEKGMLLIPKGTVLDTEVIDRLIHYAIFDIFVEEHKEIVFTQTAHKEEQIDFKTVTETKQDALIKEYLNKIKTGSDYKEFEGDFKQAIADVKYCINDIVYRGLPAKIDLLLESIKKITDKYGKEARLLDMMQCLQDYDDQTYYHSMNVGVISRMIGVWMHYNEADLDVLSIAAVLHDIGKIMMPNELITKPGRLSPVEYAFIKAHPVYGYKLLETQNIDDRIKLAAKEHHERFNGSGYPENLEGHNISEFARIIAIVDVFDAMTSNRVYRHGICPFQVLSSLESNIECYDPAILLTALERIADMYTNCDVYVNNEIKGKVVLINKQDIGRPMVMTEDGRVIDISKERSYSITSLR